MAHPKKRTNTSKKGMRRMHDKTVVPSVIYCPECHEPMMPHTVCAACGSYRGKKYGASQEVVIKKEETSK